MILAQADTTLMPAFVAAIMISLLGAVLSIFVVLKRLAFIGQGVSHAAFGGVGIALVLGVTGASLGGQAVQTMIVLAFSVMAALIIAALGRKEKGRVDTAIGIVLSCSMALGFVLFTISESRHAHDDHGHAVAGHQDEHHVIEEILFGNILATDWTRVLIAAGGAILIMTLVWWNRRSFVFWCFDEPTVDAFGVRSQRTGNLLLVLLALAVVLSMQVVGVILAAAVLVLPAATAMQLSSNLRVVILWSLATALFGAIVGFWIGVSSEMPVGPSIVLAQSACYLIAMMTRAATVRLRSA